MLRRKTTGKLEEDEGGEVEIVGVGVLDDLGAFEAGRGVEQKV